jgi:hypothetical protein
MYGNAHSRNRQGSLRSMQSLGTYIGVRSAGYSWCREFKATIALVSAWLKLAWSERGKYNYTQLDLDPGREIPQQVSTLFWHFPKCFHLPLSIADKVSNTPWAFPKKWPLPFRCNSNGLQKPFGAFPSVTWHTIGHFLYISL